MADPGDGVDVWAVPLARTSGTDPRWLAPAESARAGGLLDPAARRRFVVAHAALRGILARYLDVPPEKVPLRRGAGGQPCLAGATLRLSLAHAGEQALVAVAARAVGVDLDLPRDGLSPHRLAARYFPPDEADDVAHGGYPGFLRLWTRKEACVKAAAGRLALGLRLPVLSSGPATVVHDPTGRLAGPWFVRDLHLPATAGYAGAVALSGAGVAGCRLLDF